MTAWRYRASGSIFAAIIVAVSVGAGGGDALDSLHSFSTRSSGSPGQGFLGRHPARIPPGPRWHWVSAWAAGAQRAVSTNLSERGFRNQTIREIVVAGAQGSMIRIRFTNAFGSSGLRIGQASIAVQRSDARAVSETTRTVTFAGRQSVRISRGATVLSDPIRLAVGRQTHLLISIYLPAATGPVTEHRQADQINYVASDDHALDDSPSAFATQTDSWFFLDGVEVLAAPRDLGAVVALGDSITDGVGSPVNTNERWPNFLARRLNALQGNTLTVLDEGIGGNRVLDSSICCGLSALARFKTDLRDQAAVRDVILLEGINDIGLSQSQRRSTAQQATVSIQQIIDGYKRLIRLAHTAGIRIFGGTLTPFRGASYWTPRGEAERDAINRWIRTSGAFDGVVDFARAIRDPRDAERLAPAYDSGDHLHPNAAGYRTMANAVHLAMLLERPPNQ
jgi:lysophospholipase L1-like esterase